MERGWPSAAQAIGFGRTLGRQEKACFPLRSCCTRSMLFSRAHSHRSERTSSHRSRRDNSRQAWESGRGRSVWPGKAFNARGHRKRCAYGIMPSKTLICNGLCKAKEHPWCVTGQFSRHPSAASDWRSGPQSAVERLRIRIMTTLAK
jgi:hypothetical protein